MTTGLSVWKTCFKPVEDLQREAAELRPAMVDRRLVDGAQYAIRNARRPRNLQEMPAAGVVVESRHGDVLREGRSAWYMCDCSASVGSRDHERPARATRRDASPPRSARPTRRAGAARFARECRGDVLFDAASRGRYSTDASIYQIFPIGVVVPRDEADARDRARGRARRSTSPVLPRGAGSSQCGQTVGEALVIDHSKSLNRIVAFDKDAMTATVQPGVVLDQLNAFLQPHGLWLPVDVSTSAQATIGGMAGNNSCGSRSIAYGNMVHNVVGIDAILADGSEIAFGPLPRCRARGRGGALIDALAAIGARERDEIARMVSAGAAPCRRLQPRRLRAAERAPVHRRRLGQSRASAGRFRRHAGLLFARHGAARRGCRRTACSAW